MTPALFFQLVSWFAALIALIMGVLGVVALIGGNVFPALILFVLAGVNAFGWRLFQRWSRRLRP